MISRMRPRSPLVSLDALTTASDLGDSNLPISGIDSLSCKRRHPEVRACDSTRASKDDRPSNFEARPYGRAPQGDGSGLDQESSPQPQSAGDDAAQDFGGAALNGQLRRDHGGEGELLVERGAIADLRLEKCGELAHPRR